MTITENHESGKKIYYAIPARRSVVHPVKSESNKKGTFMNIVMLINHDSRWTLVVCFLSF